MDKFPTKGGNYCQLSQTDFDRKSKTISPISTTFKLEIASDNLSVNIDSKTTQIGLTGVSKK